jgi:hypothetical protein
MREGEAMRHDDPNVPVSVVVGLVGAILLFVAIVALQALFSSMQQAELQRKVYSQPNEALRQLRSEQLGTLGSYGFIDQAHGVVRIPIERAMELVVAERGGM